MNASLEVSGALIEAIDHPRGGLKAYTRGDLHYGMHQDSSPGLLMRVDFNDVVFDLDVIEVDTGVRIAYINESPEAGHVNLAIATAVEKARLLCDMHAFVQSMGKPNGIEAVFTIESKKSTASARLAAQLFAAKFGFELPFEVFEAKTDRVAVAKHSVITPVEYLPITAQKANVPKYLGVTDTQAGLIWDIYRRGRGIAVFVDDAFTTGNSAFAARDGMRMVTGNGYLNVEIVVDVREQPFFEPYVPGQEYPKAVERGIHAVRIFPEFIGAEPIPTGT